MYLGQTVVTPPASEPIIAAEVKASARVDGTEFDGQLDLMIQQARETAEHETGRRFITQSLRAEYDCWGDDLLCLPSSPVQSITTVQYHNGTDWQTLDAAEYTLVQGLNRIASIQPTTTATSWPTLGDVLGARVRVTYVAGYGATAADVPASARHWMVANCVYWLDNPAAANEKTHAPSPFLRGLLDSLGSYA